MSEGARTGGLRVGITGAGGYLGRPLVEALRRDERIGEVLAIDVRPPDGGARVRSLVRDVRDPALAADFDGLDAVYHLAFRVLGRGRDADSVNIDGSRNVFAAVRRAGVPALLYTSSSAAYGSAPDDELPFTEESPLRPLPPFYYPETKVAVERMLDEFERRVSDVRVVRFRPIAVLGPGAPLMLGGRVFITLSDFDPLMQFVWIDDVVDAFVAALHRPVRGAFNLGAPHPVAASTVPGLLGIRGVRAPYRLARLAARSGSLLRLPGGLDPGWVDIARFPIWVDTARAERELGWRASCDTAEALRRFGAEVLNKSRQRQAADGADEGLAFETTTEKEQP